MKFTDTQLQSFIALYKQEFGIELTTEKALEVATDLITLLRLTYAKPVNKAGYEAYLALKKKQ